MQNGWFVPWRSTDRISDIVGLEGPATIYEVSALREILREALATGNDFRIDLGDTGKWDLAGLQLLISCVRTGQSRGQIVRLFRIPEVCAEIAERSGLRTGSRRRLTAGSGCWSDSSWIGGAERQPGWGTVCPATTLGA